MYKQKVKIMGETLDALLDFKVNVNQEESDALALLGYHPSKNKEKFKKILARKKIKPQIKTENVLPFADFICQTLNKTVNDKKINKEIEKIFNTKYWFNPVLYKEYKGYKFEYKISNYYSIENKRTEGYLTIEFKKNNIFTRLLSKKEKEAEFFTVMLEKIIIKSENLTTSDVSEQISLAIKSHYLRMGRASCQKFDKESIFKGCIDTNISNMSALILSPLLIMTQNMMLYINLLKEISDKFDKTKASQAEKDVLYSLFLNNSIFLDSLRALIEVNVDLNIDIYNAAFASFEKAPIKFIENLLGHDLTYEAGLNRIVSVMNKVFDIALVNIKDFKDKEDFNHKIILGIMSSLSNELIPFHNILEKDMKSLFLKLDTYISKVEFEHENITVFRNSYMFDINKISNLEINFNNQWNITSAFANHINEKMSLIYETNQNEKIKKITKIVLLKLFFNNIDVKINENFEKFKTQIEICFLKKNDEKEKEVINTLLNSDNHLEIELSSETETKENLQNISNTIDKLVDFFILKSISYKEIFFNKSFNNEKFIKLNYINDLFNILEKISIEKNNRYYRKNLNNKFDNILEDKEELLKLMKEEILSQKYNNKEIRVSKKI